MNGMRGTLWKNSMALSDRQSLEAPAPAPDERNNRAAADHRGEQRGGDAERQRDGEALDRPGAEQKQHHARDQRRDVRVEDRGERLLETRLDGGLRRIADPQLLADAL